MCGQQGRVSVRVLGAIEVLDPGGVPIASIPKTQRRIVGLLAANAGSAVTVDRFIDVLGVSKAGLHATVSRLRKTIGRDAIVTTDAGYVLADVGVDAVQFEELLTAAAGLASTQRPAPLRDALARWRGEPFADFAHEEWTRADSLRLGELHAGAVEDYAHAQIELGRPTESVAILTAHIERHPLRDRPRSLLMSSLAAQGRNTEAMRVAREYRKFLRDEVGTQPSKSFERVERSIAAGEARWDSGDAGDQRSFTTNIAAEPDGFIVRSEVDDVVRLVDSHRLVTLVGPGGIGKSRCMTAAARELTDRRAADGQHVRSAGTWFVDLSVVDAGSGDHAVAVAAAVADAMGLQRQADLTLLQTIVDHLRTRSAILALDNCEHVLDETRALTRDLLAECSELVVVATSRLRLGVSFEYVVELGPMPAAEANDLFNTRVAEDGAGPFPAPDVAALCALLDHYPLAIELAAGWMRSMSPAEITERLIDHPELLQSKLADVTVRHASLSAALAWSIDQLTQRDAEMLSRMVVFRGPFDLAAVESVVADAGITQFELLSSVHTLVEHHLVHRDQGTAHYRLLEPIRQHLLGANQISSELHQRHAHFFTSLACDVAEGILTAEEPRLMHDFRMSLPDGRAAISWAISQHRPDMIEPMMRRMPLLVNFQVFLEVGDWAGQALSAFEARADDLPGTRATAATGWFWLERFEESEALFDELEATLDDRELEGVVAHVRSHQAVFSGDRARAIEFADRCGMIGDEIGDPVFQLQRLVVHLDPAAIKLADTIGSPSLMAYSRWFAWLAIDADQRSRSMLPDEAMQLANTSANAFCIAQAHSFLASRLVRAGDVSTGAAELGTAIERMLRLRSPMLVWVAVDQAASALALLPDQADGAVTLWAALEAAGRSTTAQTYLVPGTVEGAHRTLTQQQIDAAAARGSELAMDTAVEFALDRLEKLASL